MQFHAGDTSKIEKLGYIVLKKNHVNVHEWRFLLRVLTDKSVQRVQNSEIMLIFLQKFHTPTLTATSARIFLNHLHNDANMSTGT